MGRREERRAGAEHAHATLHSFGRPAQAGHRCVRRPPHAGWRVTEFAHPQRKHDPESQPPLARAQRRPPHAGDVRLDPLEAQAELRSLVRDRDIDRFAVQGPRFEARLRPRVKGSERAGTVGVGAQVDAQPGRQVHQRGGVVHVPGIEVPPGIERPRSGLALALRHDSPPSKCRAAGADRGWMPAGPGTSPTPGPAKCRRMGTATRELDRAKGRAGANIRVPPPPCAQEPRRR